jgi:hypothetical protein
MSDEFEAIFERRKQAMIDKEAAQRKQAADAAALSERWGTIAEAVVLPVFEEMRDRLHGQGFSAATAKLKENYSDHGTDVSLWLPLEPTGGSTLTMSLNAGRVEVSSPGGNHHYVSLEHVDADWVHDQAMKAITRVYDPKGAGFR